MRNAPHTVDDWQATISRLESDLEDLTRRDAACRQERKGLSLSVALGDQDARTRGDALELEGARLTLEVQTVREGLEQARDALRASQEAQRDAERSERARALAVALEERRQAAERLDDGLSTMAGALVQWLACGDRITTLGGDGHSSRAKGQLAAAVWYHLSESGLNRADPWQYRTVADVFSGDSRPSPARWRPLSDHP